MDHLVTDQLLRILSAETRLVGRQVIVKAWGDEPETSAIVANVIILPGSVFYRTQFMANYQRYHQNAVKALKELFHEFPDNRDYELEMGYVLELKKSEEGMVKEIRQRGEFMLPEDLAAHRREVLQKGSRSSKTSS
ncbi:MAG: hypothetical protein ACXVPQ_06685 [Bacteroidia bacterium]